MTVPKYDGGEGSYVENSQRQEPLREYRVDMTLNPRHVREGKGSRVQQQPGHPKVQRVDNHNSWIIQGRETQSPGLESFRVGDWCASLEGPVIGRD